jgi:hypothetical protein
VLRHRSEKQNGNRAATPLASPTPHHTGVDPAEELSVLRAVALSADTQNALLGSWNFAQCQEYQCSEHHLCLPFKHSTPNPVNPSFSSPNPIATIGSGATGDSQSFDLYSAWQNTHTCAVSLPHSVQTGFEEWGSSAYVDEGGRAPR